MKERVFKDIVKRWLEKRGYNVNYDIQIILKKDDSRAHEIFERAYDQLCIENKKYAIVPNFPSSIFVKEISGYPDIIGVKNGVAHAFEVKTDLGNEKLDRCIGQCLRYLTDSWMDSINVVVLKRIEGIWFLKKIISKFKLPIKIIELAVEETGTNLKDK